MNYRRYFPDAIASILESAGVLNEIRIRDGKPIRVSKDGEWYWLGKSGLVSSVLQAFSFDLKCDEVVNRMCENSAYAYENMLAQGYMTIGDGVRVGVCGEVVDAGASLHYRHYTSLCLRIPQSVQCVDRDLFDTVSHGNLLIAGPPSSGKTTFLKCFAKMLSSSQNVLVVDERGELCCSESEKEWNCDSIKWGRKNFALSVAIRAMSPDWVICDEITLNEIDLIERASYCGVKVAASIHASSYADVKRLLRNSLNRFSNVVLLNKQGRSQQVFPVRQS